MTTTNPVVEALRKIAGMTPCFDAKATRTTKINDIACATIPIAIAIQKFIEAYDRWSLTGYIEHNVEYGNMIIARHELQQLMKQEG